MRIASSSPDPSIAERAFETSERNLITSFALSKTKKLSRPLSIATEKS